MAQNLHSASTLPGGARATLAVVRIAIGLAALALIAVACTDPTEAARAIVIHNDTATPVVLRICDSFGCNHLNDHIETGASIGENVSVEKDPYSFLIVDEKGRTLGCLKVRTHPVTQEPVQIIAASPCHGCTGTDPALSYFVQIGRYGARRSCASMSLMSPAKRASVDDAIAAQARYYDLRAPEYLNPLAPSDRPARSGFEPSDARDLIVDFLPVGDVLELACGPSCFTA